jgi:hypothetical protein
MNTIIGLFLYDEGFEYPVVERLKEAGIAGRRISILSNPHAVSRLLGCEPTCVVSRYAVRGASLGIVIISIFGVVAGWCQCNFLGFGQVYGMVAFLGALLAGVFIGGFLGCILGVAKFEKDSHLYVQGVRMGGKVIAIQASEEAAGMVKRILEQENASGVKVLQGKGAYDGSEDLSSARRLKTS